MKSRELLAALCAAAAVSALAAAPCRADGSADGIDTAAAEAGVRSPGSALVEIEGFADGGGDIPCGKRSYSNTWHYKFYAPGGAGWLLVNACGGNVFNAAKHIPGKIAEEPRERLPAAAADSFEAMAELKEKGYFTSAAGSTARDVYMRAAVLPAGEGRPAGCYWQLARGQEKAYIDCDLKKIWGAAAAKGAGAKGAFSADKGADTPGKYVSRALAMAAKQFPGATLKAIEGLADASGKAKCLGPDDGWVFMFFAPGTGTAASIGACKDKVASIGVDMSGRSRDIRKLPDLPGSFKDSDAAMHAVGPGCRSKTAILRLQKFADAPAGSHGFLWRIDCGTEHHYVDAYTGKYSGKAAKPAQAREAGQGGF